MDKDYPLIVQDEDKIELLRVDYDGKVYIEGKFVGQSDKLKNRLVEYGNSLKQMVENTQQSIEQMTNIIKKARG